MKLYYMPGACSLASHIAAIECGLKLQLEKVGRDKRTESGRDYWTVNPKGGVPALELDDGEVLTENAVILQYLAERAGNTDLLPKDGMKRWRQLELLNFIATEVHKGYGPLWNPGSPPEVREAAVQNLGKKFDLLERLLGDRPYLTGETFTAADAYAFVVLNWTNVHKIQMNAWPKLQGLMARVSARPAVRQALAEEGLA